MPDVLDLVDSALLNQPPPRRLPAFFLPNLVGEYLLDQPLRAYFDPYLIVAACAAVALIALGVSPLFWLPIALLLSLRISGSCWHLARLVREDYTLLRHGVVLQAHILGVRPCRDAAGNPAGAFLDCAIPVTRKRSSVGSVWMPDSAEALRVGAEGRVAVICLTRAPGTWRLRDLDGPQLRYEPARQ